MKRPVATRYPLHELLRERWSPLAFSSEAIGEDTLGSLFEAARWAPSCYNEQPWSFVVATQEDPAEFERLAGCLVEANRRWAGQAAVLAIAVAKRDFAHNGTQNVHAWYDLGQAVAHLTFQAAAAGLYVHQMAGFSPERARTAYELPETHAPVAMFAIGRYGEHERLPEDLRQRETAPRARKPLSEFVFSGRWAQSASWTTSGKAEA